MIGQEKLKAQFSNFTSETLPHAMLFVGELGCGKHTFCKHLADKFNLTVMEITEKINIDLVEKINQEVCPTLCILNADSISIKEESVLLKFIEEPNSNIYIALLCQSSTTVLGTILNRCHIYRFTQYTDDELRQFCKVRNIECDESTYNLLFDIANTPGKIADWSSLPLLDMYSYAAKILELSGRAGLANLFNISKKIEFKSTESSSLYPLLPFVTILTLCAKNNVIGNTEKAVPKYILTSKLFNAIIDKPIFPQQVFENYLYELKEIG